MPVVFVPTTDAPLGVGIGLTFQAQSDFIGPLPSGSHWSVSIDEVGNEQNHFATLFVTGNVSQQLITTMMTANGWSFPQNRLGLQDGHTVNLVAKLLDGNGAEIDSGAQQVPWQSVRSIAPQIELQPQSAGGLTPVQAQQLQELHAQNLLDQLVDAVTLINLTPGGPSGDFVGENLTSPIFGVIVRLAQIPAELTPQTPDGDYWVPTLAVVRIFRGQDLWLRVPIHTSSKIVSLMGEGIVAVIATALVNSWFLNMSLQVSFLPGVTGEVFLMRFP